MRSTLVAVGLLLLGWSGASGQEPWITISEPGEWSQNELLTVPARTRLRVVGQAYHPQGVQAIDVSGNQATLRRQASGIVDFEAIVSVSLGLTQVRVTLQATGGGTHAKDLRLAVTAAPGDAEPRTYSPSSAAVRSLFLPGTGQFYTGRPLLGALFLGAAGGAVAAAVMSKEIKVRCLSPAVNGQCPSGQVASEEESRPMLIPGVAAFFAVGIVSALEARGAARRLSGSENNDAGFGLSVDAVRNGRYAFSVYTIRF